MKRKLSVLVVILAAVLALSLIIAWRIREVNPDPTDPAPSTATTVAASKTTATAEHTTPESSTARTDPPATSVPPETTAPPASEPSSEPSTPPTTEPEPTEPEPTEPEPTEPEPMPEPDSAEFIRIRDVIPAVRQDLRYSTADNFTGVAIYDFTDAWLRYGTVKKLAQVCEELARHPGLGCLPAPLCSASPLG